MPFARIAGEVSAVDDADGQGQQALHRGDVLPLLKVAGSLDQLAIIDDVARKQDAGRGLPQGDAAGGMAGGVDHLELPVAKVDHIAVPENALRRGGGDGIGVAGKGLGRKLGEDIFGDVFVSEGVFPRWRPQQMRLGCVAEAAGEFVVQADMVEMRVAGHGLQRAFGHQRHPVTQGDHAHPAVDQHIAVAAPDVPDVAAVEFADMRLVDMGDAVAHPSHSPPVFRLDSHSVSTTWLSAPRSSTMPTSTA